MLGVQIDHGTLTLRADLPRPEPRPGWTRVRVLRAGICATDLALARGYLDFAGTPGHEFVGLALDGPFAGERVVGEINAGCGVCTSCANDFSRHCAQRSVLGIVGLPGAFAEEIALPTRNLHCVPQSLATEDALFAEPLAAAFAIPERLALVPGTHALVVGDGKLGLLCAHVLALQGLEVTVAGRHPERAALLPRNAHHRTDLFDASTAVQERFEIAVEATGRGAMLEQVARLVRPRGTLVLKTTCEGKSPLNLSSIVVDEITVVGSRCGPLAPALRALAEASVPVSGLVAATYALGDAAQAFAHARRGGVLKIVIDSSA